MEENKKKKSSVVTLIVILIGFILFLSGLILYFVNGDKYRLGSGEVETIENSFESIEIEKLSFDLGVGKITVKADDTDKIKVLGKNIPKDSFEIKTSGDTFIVKAKDKEWYKYIYIPLGDNAGDTVFEIIVPDKEYNSIEVNCGVGETHLEGLDTKNFSLDGGIGAVDMKDCNVGESKIDSGIGEIKFRGKLLGNADIDMGIGAVTFNIDGYKDDYDIKADHGVRINSESSGSENKEKYKIVVDDGLGEIKLNFK